MPALIYILELEVSSKCSGTS